MALVVAGGVAAARDVRHRRERLLQEHRRGAGRPRGRHGHRVRPAQARRHARGGVARLETLSQQMADDRRTTRIRRITVSPLPRMSTSTSPQTRRRPRRRERGADGAGRHRAADRVPQPREHAARARDDAKEGDRDSSGARRARAGASSASCSPRACSWPLVGAAAGLVLAYWSTSFIVASLARVLPLTVVFESRPDMNVMLATCRASSAVATLIAGVGPALKLSRLDLVTDLKEQASDAGARPGRSPHATSWSSRSSPCRSGLLSGGGLFARSVSRPRGPTPVSRTTRAILAPLDPSVAQIDEPRAASCIGRILERVRSTPGIEAGVVASTVPFGDFHEGRHVERPGMPRDREPYGPDLPRSSGADYFKALGLQHASAAATSRSPRSSLRAQRASRSSTTCSPGGSSRTRIRSADDPLHTARGRPSYKDDIEPLQIVGVAPTMQRRAHRSGGRIRTSTCPFGPNYRAGDEPARRTTAPMPRRDVGDARDAPPGAPRRRRAAADSRADDVPAVPRQQPGVVGHPHRRPDADGCSACSRSVSRPRASTA